MIASDWGKKLEMKKKHKWKQKHECDDKNCKRV